jgi:ubiquinone/menaquinone biosynthesis C-methylase UbiE
MTLDARFQLRVQRYGWDKAADHYEQFWQAQLAPAQQRLLELAALKPGERVLEVACGTGLVTFPAARAVGAGGEVVATDISEVMVTRLQADANAQGLDNIVTKRADAEKLDVLDASFDVALCALGLMYVPDPFAAIREMHRALKPGGRAVIAIWGARSNCGWAEIFSIVDHFVKSEVCPMFFQLGGGDALNMAMTQGGFTDVKLERIASTLDYASGDEACGAAFAGGPVALAYSRFDEATRDAAHKEYLDSIAEWKVGDGYKVPGEFVVAAGRK